MIEYILAKDNILKDISPEIERIQYSIYMKENDNIFIFAELIKNELKDIYNKQYNNNYHFTLKALKEIFKFNKFYIFEKKDYKEDFFKEECFIELKCFNKKKDLINYIKSL